MKNDKKIIIKQVLEEIETFFIDKPYIKYRHEISKKAWNKLKRRYEMKGGENNG